MGVTQLCTLPLQQIHQAEATVDELVHCLVLRVLYVIITYALHAHYMVEANKI